MVSISLLVAYPRLTEGLPIGVDSESHLFKVFYLYKTYTTYGYLPSWCSDWYGGTPFLVFYPPLAYLMTFAVALLNADPLLAYKLVETFFYAVAPLAVYLLARELELDKIQSMFAGLIFTITPVAIENFTFYDRFATVISVPFLCLFLIVFMRSLKSRRLAPLVLSSFLLTVLILIHHLSAYYLGIIALFMAITQYMRTRDAKGIALRMALIVAASLLLSSFWLYPFVSATFATNNIFAGRGAVRGRAGSPGSECDYNLLSTADTVPEAHGLLAAPDFTDPAAGLFAPLATSKAIGNGTPLDNFAPATGGRADMGAIPAGSGLVLPERPIPVFLDRYQLGFSPDEVKAGGSKSVVATVQGQGFSSAYRIAQNEAFDWFTVTPAQGTLKSGQTVSFTVSVIPDWMKTRKVYRGVFLVRLANGYSRPVTVYARTDFVPPVKPAGDGSFVAYLEAEAPSAGPAYEVTADEGASGGKCVLVAGARDSQPTEYRFTVPADGSYIVLMRARSEAPVGSHDALQFGVDDLPLAEATLRSDTTWTWSMVAQNRQQRLTCLQPFKLKAGEHVVKLAPRESLYLDLIAVTPNPAPFN